MATPKVNELIATFDVYPDYGQVLVEEAGNPAGVPDDSDGKVAVNDHSVVVSTMTSDAADTFGRDVVVCVYRGSDGTGFGELVFDGTVIFTEAALAVGEILDLPEDLHRVPIDHTGPIHLQIYTRNTIPEVPASDPTDINILIRTDTGQ
ncbi:hypothetical protein ACWDTP_27255 [Mycobacterium sp. NPDC003449]